jgi:hypothetical protein
MSTAENSSREWSSFQVAEQNLIDSLKKNVALASIEDLEEEKRI